MQSFQERKQHGRQLVLKVSLDGSDKVLILSVCFSETIITEILIIILQQFIYVSPKHNAEIINNRYWTFCNLNIVTAL